MGSVAQSDADVKPASSREDVSKCGQPGLRVFDPFTAIAGEGPDDETPETTALALLACGFHPVAIHPTRSDGKAPIGEAWGATTPDAATLQRRYEKDPGAGVGLCLGPGKTPGGGWLIDVEGDGPEAHSSFRGLVGGAEDIETMGWRSKRGLHRLFVGDDRFLNLLQAAGAVEGKGKPGVYHLAVFPGLEFRVGGFKSDGSLKQIQSVCPPTMGTDGVPRSWTSSWTVAPIPDAMLAKLEEVVERAGKQNDSPEPLPGSVASRLFAGVGAAQSSGVDELAAAFRSVPSAPLASPAPTDPFVATVSAGPKRRAAYWSKAIDDELNKVRLTPVGARNNTLNNAACALGNIVAAGVVSEAEAIAGLTVAARAAGLGEAEIHATVRSGLKKGLAEGPRRLPADILSAEVEEARRTARTTTRDRVTKRGDEYTARRVEWLWPGLIPKNKLTTIAGAGGLGKSFVCCDLAARITTGAEVPNGGGECFRPGKVLIVNCEDDPEDTTIPRLMEAKADLGRVSLLRSEVIGRFTLDDLDTLQKAVDEEGPFELIIVDPATAFVGKADDHKNAQLQGLLAPLRVKAWELGSAIVLVTHVNKSIGNNVDAIMRIVGGVAWVNAVRSAIIFAKDPDDPSKRLMLPFKSNNGPERKGLAYRVIPTDALARIEWEGETDVTADEAMRSKPGPKARMTDDQVDAIVVGLFEGRNEIASKEGTALCKSRGVPFDKIQEARERLQIRAKKVGASWVWVAPYGLRTR